MKIIFFIFLFPLLTFSEHKPQEYEVVFTIKFNSITLERAAQVERQILKDCGDACGINIDIEEPKINNHSFWYYTDTLGTITIGGK